MNNSISRGGLRVQGFGFRVQGENARSTQGGVTVYVALSILWHYKLQITKALDMGKDLSGLPHGAECVGLLLVAPGSPK